MPTDTSQGQQRRKCLHPYCLLSVRLCNCAGLFNDPKFQATKAVDKRGRKVRRSLVPELKCTSCFLSLVPLQAPEACRAGQSQVKRQQGGDRLRRYYRLKDEVDPSDAVAACYACARLQCRRQVWVSRSHYSHPATPALHEKAFGMSFDRPESPSLPVSWCMSSSAAPSRHQVLHCPDVTAWLVAG